MEDKRIEQILENYVTRDLEDKIWDYMDKPEIISVTGPRQSGKTTLLLKIHEELDNSNYISFEDRDALDLFEEDVKDFSKIYLEGYDQLIIDEFQYADKGGKQLKYLYDHYPDKKILITGSSISEMTVKGLKYLTGRILNFKLYPFSFKEFLRYKDRRLHDIFQEKSEKIGHWIRSNEEWNISENILSRLEILRKEFTVYGGYPRVVLAESDDEKETIIKKIINTYLLREIRDVLDISEDREVKKLMKLLSLQTGEVTTYSTLSDRSGFKYQDLKDKINMLEYTFIMKLLNPFFTNKQKEIVKTPKVYFIDNGFRNGLIDNFRELENRKDRGELNENFFFSQAIHYTEDLKYWRTKSKAEVDFILDQNKLIPIEIKTTPKITRSLRSFSKKYGTGKNFVINESILSREDDFHYIPLAFSGPLCNTLLNH